MNKFIKSFLLLVCNALMCSSLLAQEHTPTSKFHHDTGVNGIFLNDAQSTTHVIGRTARSHVFENQNESDTLGVHIECLNESANQVLLLRFFEGGFINEVSTFRFFYKPKNFKPSAKAVTVHTPAFVSRLGIKLGMSDTAIICKIGKNHKISKQKGLRLLTWYTDNEHDPFLLKYRAVGYSIVCKFDQNNKLVDYYFGFEYP
jgi:hypothetical protein